MSIEHFWKSTGRSLTEMKFLLDLGAVYLNSERLADECNLKADDILRIHTEPKRYTLPQTTPSNVIVDETEGYVIVNKPAGIPIHPTLDNRIENCLSWLSRERDSKLLITNRIDVGTEGLIIFAKNEKAQRSFMLQSQENRLQKFYSAVTIRRIQPQVMKHWMKPSPYPPKELGDVAAEGWKRCQATVVESQDIGSFSECLIELQTGRTHQLRAQLSALGEPILGDQLYGSSVRFSPLNTWALRSVAIVFRDHGTLVRYELPRWQAAEIELRTQPSPSSS